MDMHRYAKELADLRDGNIRADRTAPSGCTGARERADAYRTALRLLHDMSGGEFGQALADQPTPYETAGREVG